MTTEITETKHAGGRPSSYTPEIQAKLDKAIDDMRGRGEFFDELPIMNNIAYELEVCEATLYNWCRDYPQFLESIKKWQCKRNKHFVALVPTFLKHPKGVTMFIFWAKNILKFEDVYKIEDATGENQIELEVEAESFRVQVLKELKDAERHGVDPRRIQNVRKMLDVEVKDITNKLKAGNNGAGRNDD